MTAPQSPMVEKVARAICSAVELKHGLNWRRYREHAQAALTASHHDELVEVLRHFTREPIRGYFVEQEFARSVLARLDTPMEDL